MQRHPPFSTDVRKLLITNPRSEVSALPSHVFPNQWRTFRLSRRYNLGLSRRSQDKNSWTGSTQMEASLPKRIKFIRVKWSISLGLLHSIKSISRKKIKNIYYIFILQILLTYYFSLCLHLRSYLFPSN